jgi:hypothetical protein
VSGDFSDIQRQAEAAEQAILEDLEVGARLARVVRTPDGLSRFVAGFYFCRVGFVKLNFILGARCAHDERLWVGIARNLWEEAGAGSTPPHNSLYRDLLRYAGLPAESELRSPAFATEFDQTWVRHVTTAPVLSALFSFAVYEALDSPDYRMLYAALAQQVPPQPLRFFQVHTDVRHVELFDDALQLAPPSECAQLVDAALSFVIPLQRQMWCGLLDHLEARISRVSRPAVAPFA